MKKFTRKISTIFVSLQSLGLKILANGFIVFELIYYIIPKFVELFNKELHEFTLSDSAEYIFTPFIANTLIIPSIIWITAIFRPLNFFNGKGLFFGLIGGLIFGLSFGYICMLITGLLIGFLLGFLLGFSFGTFFSIFASISFFIIFKFTENKKK